MNCCVCLERYTENRKPSLLLCGHSICTVCRGKILASDQPLCPTCRVSISQHTNFALLEAAKEYHELDQKYTKTHLKLEIEKGKNEKLQKEVDSLKKDLSNVKTKDTVTSTMLEKLTAEVQNLVASKKANGKKRKQLQNEVESLKVELGSKNDEISDLRRELDEATSFIKKSLKFRTDDIARTEVSS
eukprot:TRINITY_DN4847_c1_g1_i1.p1 TRINITY_DN4847_c1_g1~~TRINITY_DN4847_c1_g1_i1.p1  ORF type:complete len:187 (+),score=32.07 TRINITY_DN4847_c1_g1_i1:66-626(+)